jgi:hypothetical protein
VVAIAVTVGASACKVWVNDRLLCGNATSWVVNEQVVEQVEADVIEGGDNGCDVGAVPLGERGLEVGEGGDAGPVLFARGAEDAVWVSNVAVYSS